jgi:hypothetical protein
MSTMHFSDGRIDAAVLLNQAVLDKDSWESKVMTAGLRFDDERTKYRSKASS